LTEETQGDKLRLNNAPSEEEKNYPKSFKLFIYDFFKISSMIVYITNMLPHVKVLST
jgi:hypothetical protein